MTYQQAYEHAIAMNRVQAAKVFKKLMKAELAPLEDMCQSMVPARASAADYAALDNLCSDAWGTAL
jgi:hypothetical protein